jgi:formylmethanofuran dehydrogenase subunit E
VTVIVRIMLLLLVVCAGRAQAETPEEWVKLLTRVHGGFGSFLPVGIRIGEDAMKRLNAKPRERDVTFYQGEGTPCPCAADGASLAVYASAGQGTLHIAPEKSSPGTFAVIVVRPRKGGDGLKIHRADVVHAKARSDQQHDPGSARPLQRDDGDTGPLHG